MGAGCWGGGEPGLLPSLFSADVSDEDASYGTAQHIECHKQYSTCILTNVMQRAAYGLMMD